MEKLFRQEKKYHTFLRMPRGFLFFNFAIKSKCWSYMSTLGFNLSVYIALSIV